MEVIVLAAIVAASLVLLSGLQWLAVLLRELPAERRPRRAGRPRTSAGAALPELRQLERLAGEALAGDRLAADRLARLGASAARRSGVAVSDAEVEAVDRPTALLAAVASWEAAATTSGPPRPAPPPTDIR